MIRRPPRSTLFPTRRSSDLDDHGWAMVEQLLTADECETIAGLYDDEGRFRSHVVMRSEEHTSELQSRLHLVCRLLLEKKKSRITCGKLVSMYCSNRRSCGSA